jgi:hypothetical protein
MSSLRLCRAGADQAAAEMAEAVIADQEQIIAWWGENVGIRHAAGTENNAERRSSMSRERAEQHVGFVQEVEMEER